jgi:hypothetical protein
MYETTRRLLMGRKDRATGGLLSKVKELQVEDITREGEGGHVHRKEFCLVDYDVLTSYGNIVFLRDA